MPKQDSFFFPLLTPRNYNSLASVRLSALYVTSCSAALSARTHGIVGPHRGLLQPRPLHLSPPCCARVTEATRGLRLPAHPCPCGPLTSGKLSPEPSHQPSRHRARYLKSRQARRRFSSAPLLPPLANPPAPARPAPRRGRSRSPSGGVRWRRWSGPRGSGLLGWAGRSRVASSPGVLSNTPQGLEDLAGWPLARQRRRNLAPNGGPSRGPGTCLWVPGATYGASPGERNVHRVWTEAGACPPSYSRLGSSL